MPSSPIVTIFMPLLTSVIALVLLASRCDRVARRIAPDLISRPRPNRQLRTPLGSKGWLKTLAEQAVVLGLLFAFFLGSRPVEYAALAVLLLAVVYYAYTLRIRPLVQKGATQPETLVLLSLMILWVVSLGWVLGWGLAQIQSDRF